MFYDQIVPRQLKARVRVRDFEYIQHYVIYIRTMYDVAQILNFHAEVQSQLNLVKSSGKLYQVTYKIV